MVEFTSMRGFVIGNKFSQYLRSARRSSSSVVLVWTPNPHLARIYPSIFEAKRQCKIYSIDLMIWQIDESPDRYYLTSVII